MDGNEKESHNVAATVASDGSALPARPIVGGKARRYLSELRGIERDVAHYGQRGWQTPVTPVTLRRDLRWVRSQARYADGRRIVLLLDGY
jgi:hypothetical protein